MLPLMIALADVAIPAPRFGAMLTVTTAETRPASWAAIPTEDEIAQTPAVRIIGGARAALKCHADADGVLADCAVARADPDRPEVIVSALRLAPRFRLDPGSIARAQTSAMPSIVWLQIDFPDLHGDVPKGCEPEFGCVFEVRPAVPVIIPDAIVIADPAK